MIQCLDERFPLTEHERRRYWPMINPISKGQPKKEQDTAPFMKTKDIIQLDQKNFKHERSKDRYQL